MLEGVVALQYQGIGEPPDPAEGALGDGRRHAATGRLLTLGRR